MDAMFVSGMENEKRRQVITKQYGIISSNEQEGDDQCMFNFSDSFYEQGIEQGGEHGFFFALFELVTRKVIPETEGANEANLSLTDFRERLKRFNEALNDPNNLIPAGDISK